MRSHSIALALFATLTLAACYGLEVESEGSVRGASGNGTSASSNGDGNGNNTTNGSEGSSGVSTQAAEGLPCEVDQIITKNCVGCHGSPLRSGAPMALLNHADFVTQSRSKPDQKVGDLVSARMQDSSAPMPPSGLLAQSDQEVIANWAKAGFPKGTCGSPSGTGTGPTPPPPPPEVICSSNQFWTSKKKSPNMNPGLACISCHSNVNQREGKEEAPELIGGTVYPTLYEQDKCLGFSGGGAVIVTDANGKVLTLPIGPTGNFSASKEDTGAFKFPLTAKVVVGEKERAMNHKPMTGDCNSCHTETGKNGAPGRIMAP
jgi:mono/diheme cytochrome c family protein